MARKKIMSADYDVQKELDFAKKVAQKHFNEMKQELIEGADEDLVRVVLRMAMIPVVIEKMTLLKISEIDKALARDCEEMQGQLRKDIELVMTK